GSATKYAVNADGFFTTAYKGTTMTASFIDSGSNGLFFNDSSLATCSDSSDFYCPSSPLALAATTIASDNSASANILFSIVNVDNLPVNITAVSVGGPNGSPHSSGNNSFDWGLPFFFGRTVFVGF